VRPRVTETADIPGEKATPSTSDSDCTADERSRENVMTRVVMLSSALLALSLGVLGAHTAQSSTSNPGSVADPSSTQTTTDSSAAKRDDGRFDVARFGGGGRGGGARMGGARMGGARMGGARMGGAHFSGARSFNRAGVNRANVHRASVNRSTARNVNRTANRTANRNVNRTGNRTANRNVNRTANRNVNRNVNRNITTGAAARGNWRRPANYWWRPGGAVAAGAALGFVTAATAAAWAGPAPAAGYCWYYTDETRQQGFWDACP
jgi:hypothetical protein